MDKDKQELAKKVVDEMYRSDEFSRWLGIEVLKTDPGSCTVRLTVKKEMLNGFAIAHGGISYSLADSALAFSSNSHGRKSVSVETSISHIEAVREGDILTAETKEENLSDKIGVYTVTVSNQHNKRVALFKGTVYRTNKDWF